MHIYINDVLVLSNQWEMVRGDRTRVFTHYCYSNPKKHT